MFLPNKSAIRRIEWGSNHLWDVKFEGNTAPPHPFDDWFPAVSVSKNVYTMENHQLQFYLSSYSFPKNTAEFEISITYLDDQNLTVLDWATKWINEDILGGRQGRIAPLEEAARPIQLLRMEYRNGEKVPIESPQFPSWYWTIPTGSVNYEGGSTAEAHQYTLDLAVVGKAAPDSLAKEMQGMTPFYGNDKSDWLLFFLLLMAAGFLVIDLPVLAVVYGWAWYWTVLSFVPMGLTALLLNVMMGD